MLTCSSTGGTPDGRAGGGPLPRSKTLLLSPASPLKPRVPDEACHYRSSGTLPATRSRIRLRRQKQIQPPSPPCHPVAGALSSGQSLKLSHISPAKAPSLPSDRQRVSLRCFSVRPPSLLSAPRLLAVRLWRHLSLLACAHWSCQPAPRVVLPPNSTFASVAPYRTRSLPRLASTSKPAAEQSCRLRPLEDTRARSFRPTGTTRPSSSLCVRP